LVTVTSTIRSAGPYTGDGSTTQFPFAFKIFKTSELQVTEASTGGGAASTLTLDTDYSVTLNSDQDNNPGGYVSVKNAPYAGTVLNIYSQVQAVQRLSFQAYGDFSPTVLTEALDRPTILIQQALAKIGAALQFPISDPGGDPTLPGASLRAGKLLSFDANGNPTAVAAAAQSASQLAIDLGTQSTGKGGALVGISDTASLFTSQNVEGALQELALLGASYYTAPGTGGTRRATSSKLADTVNARDYSAVLDGTSDDSTHLTNAAVMANIVRVDGTAAAPNLALASVADTVFRGPGSLVGSYRKRVIPDSSAADSLFSQDIDPAKHLKQFNRACSGIPNVVLIGDSISTYFANSVCRGDMLTDVLRRKLDTIAPNGINFYNRAIGGTAWGNLMQVQYQSYIPWYSGYTTTIWLDMVKALAPDLLVMSFGMNDSSNISVAAVKAAIDYIQSWSKVPSIVLCTGLVPNPQSTSHPEGRTGQEGRDWVAGFVRSYSKFRNLGLLDFNRKVNMVRDGFDIYSSCLTKGDTVNQSGNDIPGTRECIDWKCRVGIDVSKFVDGQWFTFRTGPGTNDFVQVIRVSATQAQFNMYAGATDNIGITSTTVSFTWPTATGYGLTVEKIGNYISVYTDTDSQYGTFNAPIYFAKVVSLGGIYYPLIHSLTAGATPYADFSYGEFRVNTPSVKNSLLWGNETSSGIDTHGGSGYNHPGGFMATHVYRPVIDGANWGMVRPQCGVASVAVGTSSLVVTLLTAEIDNAYHVLMSNEGLSLGEYRITVTTATSFTISFTTATTQAGAIVWQLIRL